MQFTSKFSHRTILLTSLFAAVFACQSAVASSDGFVYVMTNQSSGNSVIQFQRDSAGLLSRFHEASTQGRGSGGTHDPLMSQDSLVLTGDGQLLLAANAGSNEISVLRAGNSGLSYISKVASGGSFPNSIAINNNLVYVLNGQGTPNISGFRLNADGTLTAIPNSRRNLPGGSGSAPADVKFSQDGTLLIVTETMTNQIDVFSVGNDGTTDNGAAMPSSGMAPFGVNFARRNRLVVAEAGTGSVSSYNLSDSNTLEPISKSVPNGQMASCWIMLTNDKSYAYISNTGSSTISSYQVDAHGNLTLLKAVATVTGPASSPIDSAMSSDSKYLYVVESTMGRVGILRLAGANLSVIGGASGLPSSIQGIAAQ